ncbi:uncharacterized protein BDZ99DRAFT_564945 [Mytilinidion resinicola]|uniref:Uncharacterized protein n=1 Tax=Mytilinidion resinicola TaxID=574789 RepID=A0A6A6ZA50_9PEZI|nr:uncharacterized protein BDZ99DRAFT_564945 [Mytilinidion resinicola]KAF2817155.1 hypothetical protein BDZ99DRAFT_564945 [Mytilinidion resinicola]
MATKPDAPKASNERNTAVDFAVACLATPNAPGEGTQPSQFTPSELYELDVLGYHTRMRSLNHHRRIQYGLPIPISPTLPRIVVAEFVKQEKMAREKRMVPTDHSAIVNNEAEELNKSTVEELIENAADDRTEGRGVADGGILVKVNKDWHDETTRVNMAGIQKTLRRPEYKPPVGAKWLSYMKMGKTASRHTDTLKEFLVGSVREDYILPPGVPMSGVEILAFYPHHLRWPAVAMRLINNSHTGASLSGIISWLHGQKETTTSRQIVKDTVRNAGRQSTGNMAWTETRHKPTPSTNISPDVLVPLPRIAARGLQVPTYAQLVASVTHLPHGLHARALTTCIEFWLQHKDLDLNVLHTAELYRALQPHLRSAGPMNLDAVALSQWDSSENVDGPGKRLTENPLEEYERGRGLVGERQDASLTFHVSEVLLAPLFAWQRVRVAGLSEIVKQKESIEQPAKATNGVHAPSGLKGGKKLPGPRAKTVKRKVTEVDEENDTELATRQRKKAKK